MINTISFKVNNYKFTEDLIKNFVKITYITIMYF